MRKEGVLKKVSIFFNNKRAVFILLLLFLFIRIIIVLLAGEKTNFGDGFSYNGFAAAILENRDWLTNPDYIGNYRPPVYPFLIAIIYSIFGVNNYLAVYIFQSILGTLTCLYIYKFSEKVFNHHVALLSLVWSGVSVFYLRYVGELLRETLVIFFLMAFFYYLYIYLTEKKNKTSNLWAFSVIYFLLIHTDPKFLFYLPFLIVLFVVYPPLLQGVKSYSIFLGITIILMIPWVIRNYIAYDGFVLINTRTVDLRLNNARDPVMDRYLKYNLFNFGQVNNVTVNSKYPTEEERETIKKGFNPYNRSEDEVIAIKKDIYPASTFLARKFDHFIQLWKPFDFMRSYRPFPDARFNGVWSLKHNLSSIICYGFLLPFMLLALGCLVKHRNKIWIFLTFPLVIHTLLHILYYGRSRYRVPVDAFIIILGSYGICYIAERFLSKQKERYL